MTKPSREELRSSIKMALLPLGYITEDKLDELETIINQNLIKRIKSRLPEEKIDDQLMPGEFDLIKNELGDDLTSSLIEKIIFIKYGGFNDCLEIVNKLLDEELEQLK